MGLHETVQVGHLLTFVSQLGRFKFPNSGQDIYRVVEVTRNAAIYNVQMIADLGGRMTTTMVRTVHVSGPNPPEKASDTGLPIEFWRRPTKAELSAAGLGTEVKNPASGGTSMGGTEIAIIGIGGAGLVFLGWKLLKKSRQ